MRFMLLLIVVVNLGLFAYGQGFFGPPPSQMGRSSVQRPPINSDLVTLGEPVLNPYVVR